MRRVTRSFALLLAFALLVSVFAIGGCAKKEPAAEEPAAKPTYTLVSEGKITVGSDTSFPPFESMTGDVAEGFDVDLMTAIGKELGLAVEFKTETFDTLVPTLKAGGKFDVIASGMFITDERKQSIDFSDEYGVANQGVAVKNGSAIASLDDLAGKKIAVQSGTTGEEWVKENAKGATIVPFKTATDQIVALQAGNVEAAVNDSPVMQYLVMDPAKGLKIAAEAPTAELYGFGVSKDNPDLLKGINDALAKLKASGEYAAIYKKWFGVEPTN
ncbi:MAG: basic amino acid ABC transporter substrate-binding protein [Coriobacteriia bacterium]